MHNIKFRVLIVCLITFSITSLFLVPHGAQAVSTPTTIGTSTTEEATDETWQRKLFYANGGFWAFYSDGTNIVYSTSVDTLSWSSPTPIVSGGYGYYFSVWYDETYVHYVYSYGTDVRYRRGIPESNGTVTWSDTEQTAYTGGTQIWDPQITVDSNGYPFD